jgi:hypothetical protein
MADFCEQCSKRLGFLSNDMKGITSKEDYEEGLACIVLCEGCGTIQVDPEGNCISKDCLEGGHK